MAAIMTKVIDNTERQLSEAVAHCWHTRRTQREKQKERGDSGAGHMQVCEDTALYEAKSARKTME